jgi:hypothetical protein
MEMRLYGLSAPATASSLGSVHIALLTYLQYSYLEKVSFVLLLQMLEKIRKIFSYRIFHKISPICYTQQEISSAAYCG